MKVVGIKAHTENDKGQVLLDLYIRWLFILWTLITPVTSDLDISRLWWTLCLCPLSYVGNVEINVEVKRYFCKAGVKGIQVGLDNSVYWAASYHFRLFNLSRRLPLCIASTQLTSSVFLSLASWDDACDSGASDWRCAHCGRSHYVFHPSSCRSISSHLPLCPFPVVSSVGPAVDIMWRSHLLQINWFSLWLGSCFFPETRHQLDWTDKSVWHSGCEVSPADIKLHCSHSHTFILKVYLKDLKFFHWNVTVVHCSAKSDSMIMDAIASFLVLPNRLVVPLVPDLHLAQLRCPLPRVKSENTDADDDSPWKRLL